MIKRMILMLLAVGLVLGGVFGFQAFKGEMIRKFMVANAMPPQVVATAVAVASDWQPDIKAVGEVRAVKGVDIAPEIAGVVDAIKFESGADVDEGAVLVQLRADEDVAKLQALEANARLADITVERDAKQIKTQAISQATVDADSAARDVVKAQVAEQKALVTKKTIVAPFVGHVGLRAVDVGQYVASGTVLVNMQQLDPVYLDFTLPQQNLPQLQVGQKVVAVTDAYPGKSFEGEISALNAKVDSATRNIQVRATFKSPEHLLLPGMYATVVIASGAPQKLVTLPQTAIISNPYGNTVYRVEQKGANDKGEPVRVVEQTFVTTGAMRGDQVAVLSGVKEGDEIVTAGQMKLRNGASVTVNNSVVPSNEAAPKVEDGK